MTEIYTPKSLTHLHVHIFFIIYNKMHSTGIHESIKRMNIAVKRYNFFSGLNEFLIAFFI